MPPATWRKPNCEQPAAVRGGRFDIVILFYWLIAIMPLDEHPIWGRPLFAGITPVKAVGIMCIIAAIARVLAKGRFPRLLYSPHAKWYLALLAVQCLSYAVHAGEVYGGSYSHVLTVAALFLVVPVMIDSYERLNRSLLVAIGALGFTSLYAIRQWTKYGDISGFRSSGLFNDSNEYSLVAGLFVPVALLWVLGKRPQWERVFCAACLVSMLTGLAFAASRGGFLALSSGLLVLVFRSRRRLLYLGALCVVILPVATLSPNSPLRRLINPSYGDAQATESRKITWRAGLRMFQANPLTGVGIDGFKPLVAQYQPPGEVVIKLAHNTYIEMAAELGIGGLVTFTGVFVAALYALEKARRRAVRIAEGHLAALSLGMQAALVQYVVGSIFLTSWWEKLVWLFTFSSIVVCRLTVIRVARHNRRVRRLRLRAAEPESLPAAPLLV